jgi:hypothetical protein
MVKIAKMIGIVALVVVTILLIPATPAALALYRWGAAQHRSNMHAPWVVFIPLVLVGFVWAFVLMNADRPRRKSMAIASVVFVTAVTPVGMLSKLVAEAPPAGREAFLYHWLGLLPSAAVGLIWGIEWVSTKWTRVRRTTTT